MSLLFRSTQVSAPTTPPTLSIGGTGFYIRHRRVNLDGGVSLWSEASEFSGASVTITPESYSDSTQLLRDEFLYSEDDITYYVIPRSGTLTGAQTVTTFSIGSWTVAVNEDSQNSALTDLNFGTFTTSSSPFKRLYVLNEGLNVGSLTFNFIDAITTEVAANYSGLIQVEIEGVFAEYSQAPSTLYNDSFLWQAPPNNLNTLGLVLPSNSFVQVKVTLLNFPLGGLLENTISLSMQVQENLRVFPLSYDSNWALNTFLYDPEKGFNYPFIEASNAGLTLTIKPFLINVNGVLVGRFVDTTFTVEVATQYTLTVSPSGALQIWSPLEVIPDNVLIIYYVTTVNSSPTFLSLLTPAISPKPSSYAYAANLDFTDNFVISYNGSSYDYAPTNSDALGVTMLSTDSYATSGVTLAYTADNTIAKGDFLGCEFGVIVKDPNGFLVALQDEFLGQVLCDFRVSNPATGIVDSAEGLPSGLISGGELSINAGDPAKFDLSAGTGRITDFYTDPLNPVIYDVSWSTFTAQTVANLATATVTHVYIDNAGNIFQSTVIPTETLRRQYILIGQLGHTNNTTIGAIVPTPDIAASPISQLRDYADAVGIVNIGNVISANGANLNINKTLGYLYKLGANFYTDPLSPTQLTIPAATAFSFRYRTQTGNGSTVSAIDPNNYDVGGVITSVPVNKVTNQRVFLAVNGNVVIQYGQILYNSISAAITGIQADSSSFIQFPNLTENFILIGIITVTQGATDLSNSNQARFFKASKFGESAASIAGSSVSTFEQVYQNSSPTPELITNATNGSVDFQCGSGADTDNVFTVKNTAGTVTFSINGNGSLLNTKLSQLAATTSAELAGVINDETGSGLLVFNNSPTFITPALGTPASGDLSNCSGLKTINSTSIFGAGDISVPAIPTPVGQTDKILTSNGTVESWQYPQNQNTTLIMRQLMGSPIVAETVLIETCTGTAILADNRAVYHAIYIPFPTLVTGAINYLATAGVFTGDNANEIGIYSYSSGTLTLIVKTANNANIWKTVDYSQWAFSAPTTLNKGLYFIGFVYNNSAQTTAPALRVNPNPRVSLGETNGAFFSSSRGGQNSLPASESFTNLTLQASTFYMGLY